jgi:hypothetical protein
MCLACQQVIPAGTQKIADLEGKAYEAYYHTTCAPRRTSMRTNAKHTPGPWACTTHHGKPAVNAPDSMGMIVAVVGFADPTVQAESEANARLIAKAPEMRQLVEQAIDLPESGGAAWLNRARALLAAIDGAEGEQ